MRTARHGILYHVGMLLLLLLLAGYLLLPQAVRYGVEQGLRGLGFTAVRLADVDTEPFGGELRLIGLEGQSPDGSRVAAAQAYANIAWTALARRQVQLQGLALSGLELTLGQGTDGSFSISGIPLPTGGGGSSGGAPWQLGIDRLIVSDSRLQLLLPGVAHSLQLDSLDLVGLRSWEPDAAATFTLQARLDEARVQLDGRITAFAAEPGGTLRLRLESLDLARLARDLGDRLPAAVEPGSGTLAADVQLQARLAAGQPSITQRGNLTLHDLEVRLDGQPNRIAQLAWNGRVDWSGAGSLAASGKLRAREAAIDMDGQPQTVGALDWEGEIRWADEPGMTSDGNLAVQQTSLALAGKTLSLGRLDWQGKAGWSAGTGVNADGKLRAERLEAHQPGARLMLARVAALTVPGLRVDDTDVVALDGADLQGLAVLADLARKDAPERLSADALQLGPSRIEGARRIDLGEIVLHGATFDLERDAAGKLPLIERLRGDTPPPAGDSGVPSARIALAGLRVQGESRLSFTDNSVKPPFSQQVVIERLSVGAMDSAAERWSPVTLAARLGEYSSLELSGKARPLADKVNVDLSGTLKALDLPPLSSYTAAKLGYNLQSGQLNSDLRLKITDNQLDSEARLTVHKLVVKAADPRMMERLTRELSMPLDSALNMLRDGDDNIRLTLPVSGDIRKPDFDLSSIINKAMGSALKTAAVSYIKYALQPYGTLITLAQVAGKAASKAGLAPMAFAAGSATLEGEAAAYLDKLHNLLSKRPQLRIQICGLATEADRMALGQLEAARQPESGQPAKPPGIPDERLLKLAEERAANIKRLLVDRGTVPERLFTCNPEIDRDGKAGPRAELLL